MSQALLSRVSRPSTPRYLGGTKAASRRSQAEPILRDLAFVFHLTQRVKLTITGEQSDLSPERAA
jgi:hypothetical protein